MTPQPKENIACMFVTDAVFQLPMSTLNELATANIWYIVVTDATFHLPTSWLKAAAPLNALAMLLTDATFQFPIVLSLNVALLENSEDMFVTGAVFQMPIGPYVAAAAVALLTHADTAVAMFASEMQEPEANVGY